MAGSQGMAGSIYREHVWKTCEERRGPQTFHVRRRSFSCLIPQDCSVGIWGMIRGFGERVDPGGSGISPIRTGGG